MRDRAKASWDAKPRKPIFYGPFARLADRWAGAQDGRAGIPVLPEDSLAVITLYLEIRDRHFLDRAEGERRRHEHDVESLHNQFRALQARIVAADQAAADAGKRLEQIPETPPETLFTTRNAVGQHTDEALIRSRRLRDHHTARGLLVADECQCHQAAAWLRADAAQPSEVIAAKERMLACRVGQLHEYTLRRCATYMISQVIMMTPASRPACPAGVIQLHASAITPSSRRKYMNHPRYRSAAFSAHFISCGRNNGARRYAAGMDSGPLGRGSGKRSGAHSVPCRGGVLAHMPIRTSAAIGAISRHPGCASFTLRKRHDAARRSPRQVVTGEVPRLALGELISACLVPALAEDGQDPRREQR